MMHDKQHLEPRKRPIQERSQGTVEDILSAAAQVFEKHGYAAGTTNRIAERAGVSIGTLYQYFPNKEAVAVALLEQHIIDTNRYFHEWAGHIIAERHGLRAALQDYVTGMFEMHCGRPRLQHVLLEEIQLPERVHQGLLETERTAAKKVADLLRLYSAVWHSKLERAGYMVVQTVESLTHRFAAHPDEQNISRANLIDELVTMLEAYMLSLDRRGQR